MKNGEDAPAGGKLLVLKNRMTGKLALHDNAIAVGYDEKSKRVYSAAGRNDFRYGWKKRASRRSRWKTCRFEVENKNGAK